MENDHLSFDRTIRMVQTQTKNNNGEILEKYKISPKQKVRMAIPWCKMVPVPIVRPTLKIDILKKDFTWDTRKGTRYFICPQ
jgi:hypothetical protein